MKQFLSYLTLALLPFLLINALGAGLLVGLSITDDPTYINYASVFDKEHRLDSLKKEPRIVIIGGSNGRFSFCSQMLKDSLKMEPINMAIHIGLGLDYALQQVEHRLQAGDILLISAEYEHYLNEATYRGDASLVDMYLVRHEWEKAFKHLAKTNSYSSVYQFIRRRIKRRQLTPEKIDPAMEVRTKYNQYGDYVGHYTLPRRPFKISRMRYISLDAKVATDLKSRIEAIQACGATVHLVHPPVCETYYTLNSDILNTLEQQLEQSGLSLTSCLSACIYADTCCYDSVYHLTKEGAALHTTHIINALR